MSTHKHAITLLTPSCPLWHYFTLYVNTTAKTIWLIIKFLIEHKIDVNCATNEGNARLLLSKNYSNEKLIDIIHLPIEHKVDLNYRTNEGNALHLLCKYYPNKNLINILKLFIDKGMNWNCIDPRILIRQNPNQEYTEDYRQLFEHIPPTANGDEIEIEII